MERLLLVWDEIDDLVGVSRCLVSHTLMRFSPPISRVEGLAPILLTGTLLAVQSPLFLLF
jgi:hypothetical protein